MIYPIPTALKTLWSRKRPWMTLMSTGFFSIWLTGSASCTPSKISSTMLPSAYAAEREKKSKDMKCTLNARKRLTMSWMCWNCWSLEGRSSFSLRSCWIKGRRYCLGSRESTLWKLPQALRRATMKPKMTPSAEWIAATPKLGLQPFPSWRK